MKKISIIVLIIIMIQASLQHVCYLYQGNIDTYIGCYCYDYKVYTFDWNGFHKDGELYLSVNDLCLMLMSFDMNYGLYHDWDKEVMIYQSHQMTCYLDYFHQEIRYNQYCIQLQKYKKYIYISHKNVYMNVSFIENILFNSEKKIEIQNKNAIIL